MECKSNNFVDNVITVIELIDTLWNVNLIYAFSCIPQHSELIDTLWNVNYFDFLSGLNVSGINRYIMECKSSSYLNLTLSVT